MLALLKRLFGGDTPVDYKALLSNGAVIIDVRSAAEFKAGHINGAVNIPLDIIKSKAAELKKKDKPVITCCRSGSRSGMAKSMLSAAGVECYNGGAWNILNTKI